MLTLRPYQERAVSALCSSNAGIVHAPAGSGKTVIGAAALSRWSRQWNGWPPSVVWFGNTIEQCAQAQAACSAAAVRNVRFGCYAGSLTASGADLVLFDECHHVAAPCIRKKLDGYSGPRWGLSATPRRADLLAQDVFDLIGPVVCKVERAELLADGHLAPARVLFHTPNIPGELVHDVARLAAPELNKQRRFSRVPESELMRRILWRYAQDLGIFQNVKRTAWIVELMRGSDAHSVLVLVGSIAHGELLLSSFPTARLLHSGVGTRLRRDTLASFASGSLGCIIATSLADEGLDLPRANVLILGAGGRSSAKAEQRTGRVLRTFAGKKEGLIHDFWDVQHYFLLAQSKARRRVYESLGYSISSPLLS